MSGRLGIFRALTRVKPFKVNGGQFGLNIVRNSQLFYSTEGASTVSQERHTGKHILSRKTFLVDYYKHLNDTNEILLYVHHNNLTKSENNKFRTELKKAGTKLNIIRNSIYNVYLRSENEADPADAETSKKNRDVVHPLSPLLNGPTGVIAIPKCDPLIVNQVLKILKSAQEKLILVGARVELKVYNVQEVEKFKDLPDRQGLQAQLVGLLTMLGGAGLVRTLEASSNVLYLTLDERRKDLNPSSEKDQSDA